MKLNLATLKSLGAVVVFFLVLFGIPGGLPDNVRTAVLASCGAVVFGFVHSTSLPSFLHLPFTVQSTAPKAPSTPEVPQP